jgi:hypothetical protein
VDTKIGDLLDARAVVVMKIKSGFAERDNLGVLAFPKKDLGTFENGYLQRFPRWSGYAERLPVRFRWLKNARLRHRARAQGPPPIPAETRENPDGNGYPQAWAHPVRGTVKIQG